MAANDNDRQKSIEKLRELIKGIKLGMFTTVTPDGKLHSRPMYTHDAEFDGDLWFMTGVDSAKVFEIRHDQDVNVAYSDTGKNLYISVSGRAQIVDDRAKIREFWNPMLKAWFEGPDDPQIRLLKVSVTEAEYWDGPSGPIANLLLFAKAMTGVGDLSDPAENETLKLK